MIRELIRVREFVIDSHNQIQAEINENEIGFTTIKSDSVEISILFENGEYECTASTKFLDTFIYVAQCQNKSLSVVLATIAMNLLGYDGKWSLYSIQKAIEEKKKEQLEFNDFCESLGYDN